MRSVTVLPGSWARQAANTGLQFITNPFREEDPPFRLTSLKEFVEPGIKICGSLHQNEQAGGWLYHAYNLISFKGESISNSSSV